MSFSRLDLLPPDVLDILLSNMTFDELARTKCVSKTLCEGVQLVVSSLSRRFGVSDHLAHLGTGWLRQMDLGLRNARVAMSGNSGCVVRRSAVVCLRGRGFLRRRPCSRLGVVVGR